MKINRSAGPAQQRRQTVMRMQEAKKQARQKSSNENQTDTNIKDGNGNPDQIMSKNQPENEAAHSSAPTEKKEPIKSSGQHSGSNETGDNNAPPDGCNYYFKFDLDSPYVGYIRSNVDPDKWVPFTWEDYNKKYVVRPIMGGHEVIYFEDCDVKMPEPQTGSFDLPLFNISMPWHYHYKKKEKVSLKYSGGKQNIGIKNYKPIIKDYKLSDELEYEVKFHTHSVPDWIKIIDEDTGEVIFDSSRDEDLNSIDPTLVDSRLDKKYEKEYEELVEEMKTVQSDYDTAQTELQDAKDKLDAIKQRIKDAKNDTAMLKKLQSERENAQKEKNDAQTKFNSAEHLLDKTQRKLDRAKQNMENTKNTGYFVTPKNGSKGGEITIPIPQGATHIKVIINEKPFKRGTISSYTMEPKDETKQSVYRIKRTKRLGKGPKDKKTIKEQEKLKNEYEEYKKYKPS